MHLSDEDFDRELRAEVEMVAVGQLPGGTLDAHPTPKDRRPWSRRHKRRDRYGRPF
jgi:hypothetical protein